MRQSTGVFALVLVFQFARVLLSTPGSRIDLLIKTSIALEFTAAIGLQLGESFFYQVDFYVMALCGIALIIYSSPLMRPNDKISLIFCLSFSANYFAYFFSWMIFSQPETYLKFVPVYSFDIDMAGRTAWVGGLTAEAMLMSIAAYIYFLHIKQESETLEKQKELLEVAVKSAQRQIAELRSKASREKPSAKHNDVARSLREVIQNHAADPFLDVPFLCKVMAMSNATLSRKLKQEVEMTPVAFIRSVKLDQAKSLIESRAVRTIGEAANASGFSNHGRFAKLYFNKFGELPTDTFVKSKQSASK